MITDYITHEEAMIQTFINEPDYAQFYLDQVLKDGYQDEIQHVQAWYNEAKARNYWNSLINNAKQTAQTGRNFENVIELMNKALAILKAAVSAGA